MRGHQPLIRIPAGGLQVFFLFWPGTCTLTISPRDQAGRNSCNGNTPSKSSSHPRPRSRVQGPWLPRHCSSDRESAQKEESALKKNRMFI